MIWLKLATEAVSWSALLWQNREQFDPVLARFGGAGGIAQAALTDPAGSLRRVGNALVFGQADGGEKVLAFIEQTSPRLDSIESAVNGLQTGQTVLSSSLASLQAVSMITLGLTALTPVVLGLQFVALNRKLSALQKQIAGLHKKFDAVQVADLRTGLDLLRQGQDFLDEGNRTDASNRLTAALPFCLCTMNYFSELLGNELSQKMVNRDEVRLLARHLSVAIAGVASCQIGLEQDQHAFDRSRRELDLLRQATRRVFHDLVARDPTPYLLPTMRESGVTIDFMANLYQQARDGGALDGAKDSSASAWFEEHRARLVRASLCEPRLTSKRKWYASLKGQLLEAVAAIEETNRVIGLSWLVERVRKSGRTTLSVMKQYKQNADQHGGETCPYLAWGFTCDSSTPPA